MPRANSSEHAAQAVEQVRVQLELVERVGEVAGDRKGAPLRQHMDLRRAGEQPRRGGERLRIDVLLELAQLVDRLADELRAARRRRRLAAAPHPLDALAIRRAALDQVAAEHLLHLREAVEAEGVGEADHRRRLDRVRLGHRRDRAEGEVVRLVERDSGPGAAAAATARVRRGDRVLQLVVGGGAVGHRSRASRT